MSGVDAPAPWRIAFDNARDPYTARNALGAEKIGGGGGGGGAPDNAEYIVAATDATLTAERVLTNTATITWDFTTPGQAKASTAAGGGNVSNSGTPTLGQYAKWVTSTTIQGVSAATVLGDIGAQPAGSYQTLDATLTALAAYNTNGLLTQTAADTFTGRTLTGPAAGITVSNGNGVAGNPTLALADDLAALEALTGTDTIYYRSGTSAWTAVTIGTNLTFTGGTLSATGGGGGGDAFLANTQTFTGTNTFTTMPVYVGSNAANPGTAAIVINGTTAGSTSSLALANWGSSAAATQINTFKSRGGGTVGTHGAVVASDGLFSFGAFGSDGAAFKLGGSISYVCEGTPGTTIPSRLVFNTASASANTERMRIDSAGAVTVTRTPPATSDNSTNVATTAWVQSVLAAGGGAATPGPPQGRLTLQVGTPVMTTTQAAQTTLIYHPYRGNLCPIYNGSTFTMTPLAPSGGAISIGTTDTTRNPSAIGASKVNDWFVWDGGAGFLYLSHGPDWTNDTTRSAGTALVMVNGILLNSVTIGNGTTTGPAASRGTYVGTTRSNASSQLDWIYGAAATNGTAGFFGLWNAYNRVQVASMSRDTTDSWASANATWHAANGSNTMRCSIVCGLDEDAVFAQYTCTFLINANNAAIGVALDSVATTSGITGAVLSGNTMYTTPTASYVGLLGIGFHFLQATEMSFPTATFVGDGGTTYIQNGLTTQFMA